MRASPLLRPAWAAETTRRIGRPSGSTRRARSAEPPARSRTDCSASRAAAHIKPSNSFSIWPMRGPLRCAPRTHASSRHTARAVHCPDGPPHHARLPPSHHARPCRQPTVVHVPHAAAAVDGACRARHRGEHWLAPVGGDAAALCADVHGRGHRRRCHRWPPQLAAPRPVRRRHRLVDDVCRRLRRVCDRRRIVRTPAPVAWPCCMHALPRAASRRHVGASSAASPPRPLEFSTPSRHVPPMSLCACAARTRAALPLRQSCV
jgi:hypothetical protein